jgi:plastocyanin
VRALASTLCVVALSSCGGGGGADVTTTPTTPTPPAPPSTSSSINVADNSFSPSATVLPVGTTVTWTWTGAVQHDVVFNDGPKSAVQATGTYSRQFSAVGTYDYHCSIHGAAMSGKVTIQ